MKRLRLMAAVGAITALVAVPLAYAAGLFPGLPTIGSGASCGGYSGYPTIVTTPGVTPTPFSCNTTVPAGPAVLTGAEQIPADTELSQGQPPQTVLISSGILANMSGTPRNWLDNGSLLVQQRGTGIVTCGTTTTAVYGADRWDCQANASAGEGRSSLVTTAALLPTGFATVNELYRTSGTSAQPICEMQEIATSDAIQLAGKTVTLSVYEAALAGLAADNGNVTTLSIIYGTGTDEGTQTPSTTPAITPAWTGIGFVVNQTPIAISTTPTRYSVTGVVPATATEVGVELCFTPTTTSGNSGTTDGFAWTGAQLEVSPSPTAYEFHTKAFDLAKALRYYYQLNDNATVIEIVANCSSQTTSIANCLIPFPVIMRVAPTMTYATGFETSTSTASTSATACTSLATATGLSGNAPGPQGVLMACASTTGSPAAGSASFLWTLGTATTGAIKASADL